MQCENSCLTKPNTLSSERDIHLMFGVEPIKEKKKKEEEEKRQTDNFNTTGYMQANS